MGLLAGHTQSSYISLFGLGIYALVPTLFPRCTPIQSPDQSGVPNSGRKATSLGRQRAKVIGRAILHLAQVCLVGAALAAVQILPSLELARLSIRSGGLSYQEAVAFSLKPLPRLLRYTFLPPWGGNLAQVFGGSHFTEYVAYVGVVPLLLATIWVFVVPGLWVGSSCVKWMSNSLHEIQLCILTGLGIALAVGLYNPLYWILYKTIPGFGLFRVPARWLFLYAFGVAMLAGIGTQRVSEWIRKLLPVNPLPWSRHLPVGQAVVAAVAIIELFMASNALPLAHPTAEGAFSSLRTAPAHILAAQRQTIAPGRFLSLSDTLYDPGDLNEIQHIFKEQLSEQEIYDYIVCTKRKEIIAPNLPLAWQVYAVDGYDGGLLPLARYMLLQQLFLEPEKILPDGRLREGLERIPPSRLLSLFGARYAITDKVDDVWIDDVFYDLAFDAVLGTDTVTSIASTDPEFTATGIGVVSFLEGRVVADGTPVAEVHVTTQEGKMLSFTLRSGRDTAYDAGEASGSEHTTRLDWENAMQIARVEVTALPFGGRIHVRGLALIDERDGSNVPLILSTDGQYRQVHSGDVKIYEVLDALPRAHVVHQTQVIENDEAALAALSDPALDPERMAILSGGKALDEKPTTAPQVTVDTYKPEHVVIQASLQAPGYLVLSDAWYPGWRAAVNGQWTTIERANVHFRAVHLDAGTHTVRFVYRPASYWVGLGISALACVVTGIGSLFRHDSGRPPPLSAARRRSWCW